MRAHVRTRLLAGSVMAAMLAAVAPAAADGHILPYRALDDSVVARNILPPGQGRHLNTVELAIAQAAGIQPASNTDQLAMYENLIAASPDLADADLADLFKDNSFGTDDPVRTYAPRADVTVVRDASDVPHVYGSTRAGVMYGAGYVSTEDRWFMMDTLRHVARGRLSEFLGASDANLASDRATRLGADYTEEELWHMSLRLLDLDEELAYLALQDLTEFTAGVNARVDEMLTDPSKLPGEYPALQLVPEYWRVTDSVALASLIGATFSVGGGGQLENDGFLAALETEHDPATARAIFDDFRNADDPEAPTNTSEEFRFNLDGGPVDPDSVARPDDPQAVAASMRASELPPVIDGPFGKIRLALPKAMSNALLVSADKSATGRPLAVFGPQVGYWSPQILMEIDLQGPGVRARGAAFPGISLYVLLGRGQNYGWSATTAVGDHVDVRAVKLCEPDGGEPTMESTHYLADGVCTQIYRRTDSWLAKPGAGGVPSEPSPDRVLVEFTTERTHHGIVQTRGTVDGEPVAFVRQRSSYLREVDATLTYTKIHDPARINSMEDLLHAFGDYFSFSFNWHLVDDQSVGFITTGRYPVVADGVDQDLPYWGDSEWDWKRLLTFDELPQAIDPPEGFITNWNNKQAPGFRASDDNYAYGSVQRKMLLHDNVLSAMEDDGKVSMVELVQAMGLAATQDLRGVKVLPLILEAIGEPDGDELAAAVDTLSAWSDAGAHRRDLDGDGVYEDEDAVKLMDALWSPALAAIFGPELGAAFGSVPLGHHNAPGAGGSAFFGGWYSHAHKDLRTVLGHPVTGPYSRPYCGGGSTEACGEALTEALVAAVAAAPGLTPRWENDAIRFSALGVQGQRAMAWQNRPTWQQVLEFGPGE
jgi:acyl-homoserine lactone acylase PvdQ